MQRIAFHKVAVKLLCVCGIVLAPSIPGSLPSPNNGAMGNDRFEPCLDRGLSESIHAWALKICGVLANIPAPVFVTPLKQPRVVYVHTLCTLCMPKRTKQLFLRTQGPSATPALRVMAQLTLQMSVGECLTSGAASKQSQTFCSAYARHHPATSRPNTVAYNPLLPVCEERGVQGQ